MPPFRSFRRGRAPALIMAAGLALLLAGCDERKPRFLTDVMAPAGSTPEQIRAFCTRLGDEAASWNQVGGDPIGPSLRAERETFARCMARHHVNP